MDNPVTRRDAMAGLVAGAAATQRDGSSPATASPQTALNFYSVATYGDPIAAIKAAESEVASGILFVVDDKAGNLHYRVRTANGSLEVAHTLTSASLAADDGAQRLGWKRSAAAYRRQQSAINKDMPPHLFDVTPAAMHASILAGTSKEDITQFLNAARAAAIAEGHAVVQLPPGQAVISDTIDLQTGSGTFKGVKFQGPGVESLTLLQALTPANTEKPLFRMLGGSGAHTNKALSGLTVKPVDATHAGRGKLLQLEGQCFVFCHELVAENLHTGIELINQHMNSFTEMNAFHNVRLVDCLRGVSMIRNGGSESFHGNCFFGILQINIPDNGFGLWLEGRSGPVYYYNAEADFRMFSGPGRRTAVRFQNAIMQNVILNMTCEDICFVEMTDSVSRLRSQGRFSSTHAIQFDCKIDGQVTFNNLRSSNIFENSKLANLRPAMLSLNSSNNGDNGDFPTLFKLQGPNVEALGLAYYDAGTKNGVYIGKVGYRASLEKFIPQIWFDPSGGIRFLSSDSSSAGIAGGSIIIDPKKTATLPRRARGVMLIMRDQTVGGVGIYRVDETTGVHLDSADSQFMSGIPSDGKIGITATTAATVIHNDSDSIRTIEYVMIGMMDE